MEQPDMENGISLKQKRRAAGPDATPFRAVQQPPPPPFRQK